MTSVLGGDCGICRGPPGRIVEDGRRQASKHWEESQA